MTPVGSYYLQFHRGFRDLKILRDESKTRENYFGRLQMSFFNRPFLIGQTYLRFTLLNIMDDLK